MIFNLPSSPLSLQELHTLLSADIVDNEEYLDGDEDRIGIGEEPGNRAGSREPGIAPLKAGCRE